MHKPIKIQVNTDSVTKNKLENRKSYNFILNNRSYNLSINTNIISTRFGVQNIPDQILDLNGIVNIIHLINRFIQSRQRKIPNFMIEISFPVKDLEFWNRAEIKLKLEELVGFFTDIIWKFRFILDQSKPTNPNPRLIFNLQDELELCFWSGGLDSYAGLLNRVNQFPKKKFILASFESQNLNKKIQRKLFENIKQLYPNVEERIFIHNTLGHKNSNEYPYARTRGLFFLISGLSLAYILGQKKIFMYENGIGALNLKLPGNYGLDQSITATFQSHRICEEFFKLVSGTYVKIENPFAFQTKSQMLRGICGPRNFNLIAATSSCDSPFRKKPRECGYCTSCLLRRFSLYTAELKDEKSYFEDKLSNPGLFNRKETQAMYGQYKKIEFLLNHGGLDALYKDDPDFYRAEETSGLEPDIFKNKLNSFLNDYIQEWKKIESQLFIDQQNIEEAKAIA